MSNNDQKLTAGSSSVEVFTSSSARLTDFKLEGIGNFLDWKKIIRLTLTGRNQHNHLTESKPANDANWDVVDALILSQMLGSMEKGVVRLVTHCDTVKQLWEYLDVLYSGRNNLSRVYELSQAFYRSERKGRPITEHFADFKRLYEELHALLPISTDVEQM